MSKNFTVADYTNAHRENVLHITMKPGTKLDAPKPFSETQVTITLSGAEWFAFLARAVYGPSGVSLQGAKVYNTACGKLSAQLLATSNACKRGE